MWVDRVDAVEAKSRLIRCIGPWGQVASSNHAVMQMAQRRMTTQDVENVLRGGWVPENEIELEKGSWRYHVRTHRMCVVVAFRSEQELVVVTAWREGE